MIRRFPLLGPILVLILAMISIQGGAALAKGLFPILTPQGTAAIRVLLSALILCAVTRPWRTPVPQRARLPLAIYGLSLGAMNLLFYLAIQRIPLGVGVALEFVGPLTLAVATSRGRLDILWALLAGFGIFLIMPVLKSSAPLDPVGILLALAAGVMWALYIVFGQSLSKDLPEKSAVALGMMFAVLSAAPYALLTSGTTMFTLSVLPLAVAVAVLSSALPYMLEMVALKRLPVPVFSTLMSMEPAIAACSGLLFLSERLTTTQWAAIACVILASAGSSLSARKARTALEGTP